MLARDQRSNAFSVGLPPYLRIDREPAPRRQAGESADPGRRLRRKNVGV